MPARLRIGTTQWDLRYFASDDTFHAWLPPIELEHLERIVSEDALMRVLWQFGKGRDWIAPVN